MSGQEATGAMPKECGKKLISSGNVWIIKNGGESGKWVTECISKLKEKADAQSQGERKVEQTIVGASTGVAGLGAGIATGVWIIPKLLKFFR